MTLFTALPGRRRVSSWHLASVEAAAFFDTPQAREQWPVCRRGSLRVAMWVVLLLCDRRVNDAGTALCLLSMRPSRSSLPTALRAVTLCGAVTLAAAVAGLVWWPLPWCLALLVLAAIAPCAWSGWQNRLVKKRLDSFGPAGPFVFVHGVARAPGAVNKGAGAVVMARLAEEADQRGWLLALDAGAPRLVEFYRLFGFEALGPPVATTWGSVVRMARRPLVTYA